MVDFTYSLYDTFSATTMSRRSLAMLEIAGNKLFTNHADKHWHYNQQRQQQQQQQQRNNDDKS